MMTKSTAPRPNLVRTLELMWGIGSPLRRGPKAKVDVRDLVAAAIEIADREGLSAVSTRRVADSVGLSVMSFYTHIPDKAVLLDLMLDAVAAPAQQASSKSVHSARWRDNVTEIAMETRAFLLAHPWVLQITNHRPGVGPNSVQQYDRLLRAFDGLGLDEIEMDLSATLLTDYVHGSVRHLVRARTVEKETGLSDAEWWQAVSPVLAQIDFSRFTVAERVGSIAGAAYGLGDPDRAFRFGLERLLDGFAVLVRSRG